MEHQLWRSIVVMVGLFGKQPRSTRFRFNDERIVQVFYWAVIHDRPISWARCRKNWPIHLRGKRVTVEYHHVAAPAFAFRAKRLEALEQRLVPPQSPGLFWTIDGKPLVIGGASKDRQSGYGRAARGKARGYKIHAIVSNEGIAAWRVAPMNMDERTMAARLLRSTSIEGYLVADSNYDSNPLHQLCDRLGNLQLITPRRYGKSHGLGHHRHAPGRLRSIERTENPFPDFADGLLHDRDLVERTYGNLVNWGGGLTTLPAWVRTHRRVHRWVQAKLVLAALKRRPESTTYVA